MHVNVVSTPENLDQCLDIAIDLCVEGRNDIRTHEFTFVAENETEHKQILAAVREAGLTVVE